MLRFLTGGESHGVACTVIIDGVPANLELPKENFLNDLILRQIGCYRGWRQAIDENEFEVTSGIHHGKSTGAPISITMYNTEGRNNSFRWKKYFEPFPDSDNKDGDTCNRYFVTPGHADLPASIKYRHKDSVGDYNLRYISDRASARETIARVAAGTIAKKILEDLGIEIFSFVTQVGKAKVKDEDIERLLSDEKLCEQVGKIDDNMLNAYAKTQDIMKKEDLTFIKLLEKGYGKGDKAKDKEFVGIIWDILENRIFSDITDCDKVKCPDEKAAPEMVKEANVAKEARDSVGGVFKVVTNNLPIGLGSYVQFDKRLESKLAAAVLSIPAVKGVEFGIGFGCAEMRGSEMHGKLSLGKESFERSNNFAGGLEGGITNGEPLIISAAVKPISMINNKGDDAIKSVNLKNGKEEIKASGERSDVCILPNAAVVGEAMIAIELVNAIFEKFGCDNIAEIKDNLRRHNEYVAKSYQEIYAKDKQNRED